MQSNMVWNHPMGVRHVAKSASACPKVRGRIWLSLSPRSIRQLNRLLITDALAANKHTAGLAPSVYSHEYGSPPTQALKVAVWHAVAPPDLRRGDLPGHGTPHPMRATSPSSNSRRRAKSRKQRFLSLSRELAATPPRLQNPEPALRTKPGAKHRPPAARRRERSTVTRDATVGAEDKPLDLFPMHPEPQALEEDDRHAAAFFEPDYYATATLTSLLGPDQDNAEVPQDTFSVPAAAVHSPASSSPVYGASEVPATRDLARSVLRGRERWVLCQQQQQQQGEDQEEGEASSCGGATVDVHRSWWGAGVPLRTTQLCFLKLDYDEVLSAWSGAGSVYVEGEAAQVVPDNNHHHYLLEQPAVLVEVGGSGGGATATGSDSSGSNLWVVPEDSSVGGREARVLRYKEKRQNRLFAKRIRYEVRKLNAQKRPRIKGRFVKRTQEQA